MKNIRVLNSNGQNIQIIQQSDAARPATIQQATINGQPVLLQVLFNPKKIDFPKSNFQIVNSGDQNGAATGQVINQVLPVATKIETPKKRPIEATYTVAPVTRTIEVASAISSQTLNRSGGLNSSLLSQASNGNGSFHDLNGPAAKRARLARGGLRICAKVKKFSFLF